SGGGRGGCGGAIGLALGALPGAFLGLLAGLALVRVAAGLPLDEALLGELARDAVGGLGALLQPLLDPLDLEADPVGIVLVEQRVVGADLFDEAAVARAVTIGDDDRIVGPLLRAATG